MQDKLPHLRVANIINKTKYGYELSEEGLHLAANFAPEANADYWQGRNDKPEHFDVLISTDALGAGLNLQDASVVINYDLAWTPDVIIQRSGRVLRFWKEPRRISLYIFTGDFKTNEKGRQSTQNVERRLEKLTRRGQQAEQFSGIPLFSVEDSVEYISLGELAPDIEIHNLGLADITEIEEFTGVSGYLRHITELKQNAAYAESIPDDISSAMTWQGEEHLLYYCVINILTIGCFTTPGEKRLKKSRRIGYWI